MILGGGHYFGRALLERSLGALRLVQTSYARGEALPSHAHANPYGCFVLRGRFVERDGRREHVCEPGTVIVNLGHDEHRDAMLEDGTTVLNVELDARWVESLRELGLAHVGPRYVTAPGALAALRKLERELASHDACAVLDAQTSIAEVVAFAVRGIERERRRGRPAWLEEVVALLHDSFRVPPSLTDIGRVAGVAPTHAAHVFRERLGCSIGAYVRRVRVEHALRAVETTRRPLAEIALESGFTDQSHMNREFVRHCGVTPGRVRRGH